MDSNADGLGPYVERITRGASWRTVADVTGIDPSTLTRQFNRGRVPATTIIAIARAFRGDIVDGLVAGGFLTVDEADAMGGRASLRSATDLQLAVEILRRAQQIPLPDLGTSHDAARVVEGYFEQDRSEFADDSAASDGPITLTEEADDLNGRE